MIVLTKNRYRCLTCKELHYFKRIKPLVRKSDIEVMFDKDKSYFYGTCAGCGTKWWFSNDKS